MLENRRMGLGMVVRDLGWGSEEERCGTEKWA
jgi:hypothetical protein